VLGFIRWSKLLLSQPTVKRCHKSDDYSSLQLYPQNSKTLELPEKHNKHVLQLAASCY